MVATYVYCVVRSARKPATTRVPGGLPGGDRPAAVMFDRGLWLVTATVPLDRYGPSALEALLRDLESVSSIALAHEAVVEYFSRARGATVIPTKLFTMFSTGDRAIDEMRSRRRELGGVFRRIAGCEEWGVRVMRGQHPRQPRSTVKPTSGAAFLAERKKARDESKSAVLAAAQAADTAFSSLSEIARDRRRRDDQPPGAVAPLLDAAFLVPARRRARFHAAAGRLAKEIARSGAQMTLTGPWPPYNFVGAEETS